MSRKAKGEVWKLLLPWDGVKNQVGKSRSQQEIRERESQTPAAISSAVHPTSWVCSQAAAISEFLVTHTCSFPQSRLFGASTLPVTQAGSRCLDSLYPLKPTFHSLRLTGLKDGAREGLSVVSVTDCQYAARKVDVGKELARRTPVTPLPQFYACFKNDPLLTIVQLFAHTNNYLHTMAHFITSHSLNSFDLTPPIIPFQN